MRWSIAQGFREDNPADDQITAALGNNTKRAQHLQALHHTEIASALAKVRMSSVYPTARLAFEFAVLNAARSGEARGARSNEIQWDEALWEIPAERMKGGRPHRVPLSDQVLEVLATARKHKGRSELLFPRKDGREWPAWKMSKLAADLNLGGTLHGMRSAFRDWCSETGVTREVAESCLAHQISNAAERAYARSDLIASRRKVMNTWGAYISHSIVMNPWTELKKTSRRVDCRPPPLEQGCFPGQPTDGHTGTNRGGWHPVQAKSYMTLLRTPTVFT
jgi:integrase